MRALEALEQLGCEASLSGKEPTSKAEYLERVTIHTGTRPSWSDVEKQLIVTPQYTISKITIINRLEEIGKLPAAIAALKSNDVLYEKWSAIGHINSDNPDVISLFDAIGMTKDEIKQVMDKEQPQ